MLPLYPVPNNASAPNLDVELNERFGRIEESPHIMMLPSQFPPFVKVRFPRIRFYQFYLYIGTWLYLQLVNVNAVRIGVAHLSYTIVGTR